MEKKPGGYKNLLVYRTAVTIFDLTNLFCNKFLPEFRYRRTVEQMIQAARSGKQNIVEASKELSMASDITLNSVSRSSYSELQEDYEDYLRLRNIPIWKKDDTGVLRIRSFREKVEVETKLSDLSEWTSLDFSNQGNFANLMVSLCFKQGYLMDKLLQAKQDKFIREGGFRENLYKKRRQNKLD